MASPLGWNLHQYHAARTPGGEIRHQRHIGETATQHVDSCQHFAGCCCCLWMRASLETDQGFARFTRINISITTAMEFVVLSSQLNAIYGKLRVWGFAAPGTKPSTWLLVRQQMAAQVGDFVWRHLQFINWKRGIAKICFAMSVHKLSYRYQLTGFLSFVW